MTGKLITFSGADGCGKSTQIQMLLTTLARHGIHAQRMWHRPGYSELLNGLRLIFRSIKPKSLPSADQPLARSSAFARTGVTEMWVATAVADLVLQFAVILRASLLRGTWIICDRYLHDAFLDLQLWFPRLDVWTKLIRGPVQAVCPTPDLAVLLLLSEEVQRARLATKAEQFPESAALSSARREAYENLACSDLFMTLDAEKSAESLHEIIASHLGLRSNPIARDRTARQSSRCA